MSKLSCIIIEDEPNAARSLARMLSESMPDIEVSEFMDTVRSSIDWLSNNKTDLIFLDIHLADGSGFDIFTSIQVDTPIIFTTAYDQYAIKAFELNSVDYLLKPVEPKHLERALEKFRQFHDRSGDQLENVRTLLAQVQQKPAYRERFMLQAGSRIWSVKSEDIAYVYSREKETYIMTREGRDLPFEQSVDRIELELDPTRFFRINRKMLVNFHAIAEIVSLSKSRLKLKLKPDFDEEVLVSFNKGPEFRRWLDSG